MKIKNITSKIVNKTIGCLFVLWFALFTIQVSAGAGQMIVQKINPSISQQR